MRIVCVENDGDASRQSLKRGVDARVDAVQAVKDEVWS
jgi:hypothetical protein